METSGCHRKFFFSKDKREYNEKMTRLRASTYLLDKDYKMYKIQTELNDETICHYYLGLVLGIIFLILSIAWFIHM